MSSSPPAGSGTAIVGRVRYVRSRVLVAGSPLTALTSMTGDLELDLSIDVGQNTLTAVLANTEWVVAGNLWGNKLAEAYVALGGSPRSMAETKIFTGYTYQKKDSGDIPSNAKITFADASIAYSGVPVCYSIGAYSGKRRDEIIAEVAATVGVTL